MPQPPKIPMGPYLLVDILVTSKNKLAAKALDTRDNTYKFFKVVKGDWVAPEQVGVAHQARAANIDPRVLPILDCGDVNGDHFFVVTTWLDAPTALARIEKAGPPPWQEAARYGLQLIEIVANLLTQTPAIIHGDIKPENIFLDSKLLLLSDFGIAKELDLDQKTHTLNSYGSKLYTEPERLPKHAVTEFSDVWGCCATQYYLMAGVTPFEIGADGEPDYNRLLPLPPAVPASFTEYFSNTLQRDPRDRIGNVLAVKRAFVEAIEAAYRTHPLPPRPWPLRYRRAAASAVFGAALALAAYGGLQLRMIRDVVAAERTLRAHGDARGEELLDLLKRYHASPKLTGRLEDAIAESRR